MASKADLLQGTSPGFLMVKKQRLDKHIRHIKYFKLWRDYDLLCTIFTTIGLVI